MFLRGSAWFLTRFIVINNDDRNDHLLLHGQETSYSGLRVRLVIRMKFWKLGSCLADLGLDSLLPVIDYSAAQKYSWSQIVDH